MGIFISVGKTCECVICALVLTALLMCAAFKQAGVLQSSGYRGKKYLAWLKKKGNLSYSRYVFLAMLCALASALIGLTFSFVKNFAAIISLVAYPFFFVLYLVAEKKSAIRSTVNPTARFKRFYVIFILITLIFSYLLVTLLNFADYIWGNTVFSCMKYAALGVTPLVLPLLMLLANAVDCIYELPHNKKFILRAKKKLSSSKIKVIAITGSYGKTSVKNILYTMLSQKYKVLCTPASHNTPIGIALAINNANLDDYDYFIAEMGARHVGDIAELCDICPPDISLITGICGQHLETFNSFQNILKAKSEIVPPTKGETIIADDCFLLFADYPYNIVRCPLAEDVVCDSSGTKFTLPLNGDKKRVSTVLLGKHCAQNISIAAQAALRCGMTSDEIAEAVGKIQYIEHRLQLIENGGVNILDDGYNGNVSGARAALDALKLFGGRKVVVTCGLVELGVLEQKENCALGRELVGFDYIILVGDTLVKYVEQGYREGGGDMQKIEIKPSLMAAQESLKSYLQRGDAVLFLNDLPDIY